MLNLTKHKEFVKFE
ncbi:Protein of unknown function [Bacillus cereus]|nr:Protein of unknown function [Bacillus cereus]